VVGGPRDRQPQTTRLPDHRYGAAVHAPSGRASRLVVSELALTLPDRPLLQRIDLEVTSAESVAVMGPSGAGKTSLLNCIAGLTAPVRGQVFVDGTDLTSLRPRARADFRLRHIGFVFQFAELMPELTVVENVALPLRLVGAGRRDAEHAALRALERVGLGDRGDLRPDVLSGGEAQRTAVARALVHGPKVILADEPTGALDEQNTTIVVDLLRATAREVGAALVTATHDPRVAAEADRTLVLREGVLSPSEPVGAPTLA
jgi:putative ABC transport system ATP-binding protein